jgi:hypothetical protein
MFVVVDKKGELVAASFAPEQGSRIPHARPMPTKKEHTAHEIEVPDELAANPTVHAMQAAVNAIVPRPGAKKPARKPPKKK